MTQPPDMARGWSSVRWLIGGVLLLAGAVASFAAGAPAIGAVLLVLMVLCGVVALVLMMRLQSQARAWSRSMSEKQDSGR